MIFWIPFIFDKNQERKIGLYQGSLRYVFHETDEKSEGIKKSE